MPSNWQEAYADKRPKNQTLFDDAKEVVAGGVGHDFRFTLPFPLYIERSAGSRMWDADGNEYIDYSMGNAAHMLGHGPPEVLAAIHQAVDLGLIDAQCALIIGKILARRRQIGAQIEEIVLQPGQHFVGLVRCTQTGQTDAGVGFVDGAVCRHSQAVLFDPRPAAERGFAAVAAPGSGGSGTCMMENNQASITHH